MQFYKKFNSQYLFRAAKKRDMVALCLVKNGGEGGIRTHAGLPPNGFQDRLVMTTSIPLHIWWLIRDSNPGHPD